MPYVTDAVVHDADSHLMELPDALDRHLDAAMRLEYDRLPKLQRQPRSADYVAIARAQHEEEAFRALAHENILQRKNYQALGAFRAEDRGAALDQLGFASQLVFTTWCLGNFDLDESGNLPLCYAVAHAHNRMMTEFCATDRRLLATGYVPLVDFERAIETARLALALGCKALLIPSKCPPGHSPSHQAFDALWALAQEAGVPILFHVGGEQKMNPDYFNNGLERVKDFHGGEENFTSLSFMTIPHSVQQTLAALIIDGVLERFPRLKFGVIELGASWVPSWMRFMDAGVQAFRKHEARLQKLSMLPSDYVRRQVRVTPYPHEDVGWIIANTCEEMCLFSSDYPHIEGGRNPIKRFNESLTGRSSRAVQRFYRDNFVDLMGHGLAPSLRGPAGA
jgi:predicted TIM-barrel fold metal-dependent hydrolase